MRASGLQCGRIPEFFIAAAVALLACAPASGKPAATDSATQWHLLDEYCSACHNDDDFYGGLTLSSISATDTAKGDNTEEWEKILRMMDTGEMPPRKKPQPTPQARAAFTHWLQGSLDAHAAVHPNPGRATLRRLNRAEYANAVRDLLHLDVDVAGQLPGDDSGYGFDNIADVLSMSPTLLDRYLSVAGRLSRLAVGRGPDKPFTTTWQVPKDGSIKNQGIPSWDEHASDALPLDSRGGAAFHFYAPQDGTYEIAGWLNANTNNESDRLRDNRVSLRVPLRAGPHSIGITFRRQLTLDESVQTLHNDIDYIVMPVKPPAPLPLLYVVDGATVGETTVPSYYMSPRFSQVNWPRDVLQIDVEGPFTTSGPGDTPSRRHIFQCRPSKSMEEAACARLIMARLARQAWRRPVADAELAPLLAVYEAARGTGDFEQGVAAAVEALLVSPGFLFVREQDPADAAPGSVHPLTSLELASRLALFLWSSLPDDQLLDPSPRRMACASPAYCRSRSPACWRIRARMRSPAISPASGCTCATSTRCVRMCSCSPVSTPGCAMPCAARPRCSSPASCATTAACWISSMRTTPS